MAKKARIPSDVIAESRKNRDRRYQQLISQENIDIAGVGAVLESLSKRYRMAVITSAKQSDFEFIHNSRPYKQYMEFILTVEDFSRTKPYLDPYLVGLHKFGANPRDVVVIEAEVTCFLSLK